jgi:hypothetical protein
MKLQQIRNRYEDANQLNEPQRTNALVDLMNVLEREYHTFQTWSSGSQAPDLTTPEMGLYQEISNARVFSD